MLSRLAWRLVTPRQARRISLVFLLVWSVAAFIHDDGVAAARYMPDLPKQLHPSTSRAD